MLTVQPEYQRIFLKEKHICEPNSFLSQAARWLCWLLGTSVQKRALTMALQVLFLYNLFISR